jgi:hypothetical protein
LLQHLPRTDNILIRLVNFVEPVLLTTLAAGEETVTEVITVIAVIATIITGRVIHREVTAIATEEKPVIVTMTREIKIQGLSN